MSRIIFGAILIIVGVVFPVEAQPTASNNLGEQIDQYLARLAAYGFSGTVLVAKDNQVLLHKGYGWADVQNRTPATTETIYDIASLTKQFTATAILKLESQGKLKVADSIAKYLPDVPADKRGITLHHLLDILSGFQFECAGADKMTREQFVQCMLSSKLRAEPGKRYEYSNAGFGLLAAIIETVSKQSYEGYLQENLFKPAKLQSTCFQCENSARLAHAYDEAVDHGLTQNTPLNWNKRGAWGLSTVANDFFKWEQALRQNVILSAAATKKLFTFHVPTDANGSGYGYGWALHKTARGTMVAQHDGITFEGFNALYQRYLDEGVTVIVLSNKMLARFLLIHTVAPAIEGLVFQKPYALPPTFIALKPEQLKKYDGVYQLPSGAKLIVKTENDALQIGAEGQEAINVLSSANATQGQAFAQYNELTFRLINEVQKHEYALAIKAFAQQATPDEAKQTMDAWLARLEKQHGVLKTIEVIGTAPEPEVARSFVRLGFERGVELRRLRWEGENLGGIAIALLPVLRTTFLPQSATEFTGFHLGLARPIPIQFVADNQTNTTGIQATLHGKTVLAKKVH